MSFVMNTVSESRGEIRQPTTLSRSYNGGEVSCLSQTNRPHTFRALTGENISVCLSEFSRVRRYRDFCRVEAVVRVVFQVHPSLPNFEETILTSVPAPSALGTGVLRKKLVRSAINLVLHMQNNREKGLVEITLSA